MASGISALKDEEAALEAGGSDSGRLLTIYSVSLQRIKKIDQADVVVGIDATASDAAILTKPVDPTRVILGARRTSWRV